MKDDEPIGRETKRQRETPVSVEDFMREARVIWRRQDVNHSLATATEDRDYREMFGCSVEVTMIAWDFLAAYGHLPEGGRVEHMLWALMWMKVYGRKRTMCTLAGGVDIKTFMKWVMKFVYGIAYLEGYLVGCYCYYCYCLLVLLSNSCQPLLSLHLGPDCLGEPIQRRSWC